MPDLDSCHYQVAHAVTKAGWTVDARPLHITDTFGNDFFIDLTAVQSVNEGLLEIAIEVKCFTIPKKTAELRRAIGQCIVYKGVSEREGYTMPVYMAVPTFTFVKYFNVPLLAVLQDHKIKLVEIDLVKEEIVRWIE